MNESQWVNPEVVVTQLVEMATIYGPKFVGAVVVWIVGGWVIKAILNGFSKALETGKTDNSLRPFLTGIASAGFKILLVITVLSMLGIEMTSFIAIFGAAGLAVGMALSGTLQNFAGGVIILLFKPFKAGDIIEAGGFVGSVSEIQYNS